MLNTIKINLKTDIKTDRPTTLPIKLMSQDKNNNQFILRFTNGGESVTLDDSYTVEVLTKFTKSGASRLTAAKVRLDYATWEFDTAYITQDEKVVNYVYVRKAGSLVVSADANAFVFDVGLSEIDKDAGRVAEVYDENYQKYLDEFKENVDFEEIAQAEQARKEAETLREESYEQKVDTALVEADVVEKVDNKVTELTPRMNELTAQLAQKARKADVVSFQSQLDSLVLGAVGDGNNAEVIQGRTNIVGNSFPVLKKRLDDIERQGTTNLTQLALTNWGRGVIRRADGSIGASNFRIYTEDFLFIGTGETLIIEPNEGFQVATAFYDKDFNFQYLESWSPEKRVFKSRHPYIKTMISKVGDGSIYPEESDNVNYYRSFENIYFEQSKENWYGDIFNKPTERITNIERMLINQETELPLTSWKQGVYYSNSGNFNSSDLRRIATNDFVDVSEFDKIIVKPENGYKASVTFHDENYIYKEGYSWFEEEKTINTSEKYMNVILSNISDTNILVDEGINVQVRTEIETKNSLEVKKTKTDLLGYTHPTLASRVNAVESLLRFNEYPINNVISWTHGMVYSDTGVESIAERRIMTDSFLRNSPNSKLIIEPSSGYLSNIAIYDENKNHIGGQTFIDVKTTIDLYGTYFKLTIRREDEVISTVMDISEADNVNYKLVSNEIDKLNSEVRYFPTNVPAYDGTGKEKPISEMVVSDLYGKWEDLLSRHPNFVTRTTLGKDQSNFYDVFKYEIKPKNPTMEILVVTGIHGDTIDHIGGDPLDNQFAVYEFFADLLDNWTENEALEQILHNAHFVIVPCANPWGFDNKSRYNSRQVDVNRNFDYRWEEGTEIKGDAPFSEVEAQYIRDILLDYEFNYVVDIHAYGGTFDTFSWPALTNTSTELAEKIMEATGYLNKNLRAGSSFGGGDTPGTLRLYSEDVIGVDTATLEFRVFNGDFTPHSKAMMSLMVKWYGNIFNNLVQ